MSQFKTPEEAIAACDAECERAWQEYLTTNKLDPAKAPEAAAAAYHVFRQGYMAGARFVSGIIMTKMMTHGKTHIIEPSKP